MKSHYFINKKAGRGLFIITAALSLSFGALGNIFPDIEAYADVSTTGDYTNIAIARVTDYVNVRSEANTDSEALGKIYNNCAASILETVEGGRHFIRDYYRKRSEPETGTQYSEHCAHKAADRGGLCHNR